MKKAHLIRDCVKTLPEPFDDAQGERPELSQEEKWIYHLAAAR